MGIFDNVGSVDCSTQTCDGALSPANTQNRTCPANISQAEINTLILWNPNTGATFNDNAPTNWGQSIASSDFNIDNTDATDVAQKQFWGVGSIDAPENLEQTINDGQTVILDRTRTLTFTIFDIGDDTYDYFRELQCDKIRPYFIYGDLGGYLYGVDGGLVPKLFQPSNPKSSGEDAINQIQITIAFDGKTDPDRVPNPL